jgi:hypothetical protein
MVSHKPFSCDSHRMYYGLKTHACSDTYVCGWIMDGSLVDFRRQGKSVKSQTHLLSYAFLNLKFRILTSES